MTTLLQHVLNGVVVGSIYALVALGVTMVYGLTRLINFAHGEIVTLGALATFALTEWGVGYFVALVPVTVAGGLLGAALDRGLFRFTRERPINGFLVSLGLIAASQALVLDLTDDEPKSLPSPLAGDLSLAGVRLSTQRAFVLVVVAVMFVAFFAYLLRTRAGRATRAYAENPEAAALMGVRGERVVLNVFVLGSAQAALAGGLLLGLFAATPSLGAAMIVKSFAVALIGGLGSVLGALLAGLGIGVVEALGTAYVSSTWTAAFGYLLMLGVLMVRPTGLARGGAGAEL